MTNETEVEVTRVYERGGYRINHPRKADLSLEQRAFQMWAVHPDDLKAMGMSREQFFLTHLETVLASRATDTALAEELRALIAERETERSLSKLDHPQALHIAGAGENRVCRKIADTLPRILAVLEGKRT